MDIEEHIAKVEGKRREGRKKVEERGRGRKRRRVSEGGRGRHSPFPNSSLVLNKLR